MSWYDPEREDKTIYKVVVNHEEQYSIWPADRENALGWNDAGKSGTKAECLAYIEEVWTDMRPLSLRKQMEEYERRAAAGPDGEDPLPESEEPEQDDLLKRLSEADQNVEVSLRPERSARALKERIDLGHVHIKFTGTRGGTELGVELDRDSVNLDQADFDGQKGSVHLEGGLTLNFVKVRCVADIDLATLAGKGHLQVVEQA
ncbi:MAG TPA: MbtH family NRPS accessory protein [Pyrinomonadaceae bacterium]|jgi:uncharacterized protein YbdZ (MbtH family)